MFEIAMLPAWLMIEMSSAHAAIGNASASNAKTTTTRLMLNPPKVSIFLAQTYLELAGQGIGRLLSYCTCHSKTADGRLSLFINNLQPIIVFPSNPGMQSVAH
jgi:hypothetical protein